MVQHIGKHGVLYARGQLTSATPNTNTRVEYVGKHGVRYPRGNN